jgi:hypothetical protein
VAAGYVDPGNLLFARERVRRVREAVPATHAALATLDGRCAAIYREQPFQEGPDLVQALRRLLASPAFARATGTP